MGMPSSVETIRSAVCRVSARKPSRATASATLTTAAASGGPVRPAATALPASSVSPRDAAAAAPRPDRWSATARAGHPFRPEQSERPPGGGCPARPGRTKVRETGPKGPVSCVIRRHPPTGEMCICESQRCDLCSVSCGNAGSSDAGSRPRPRRPCATGTGSCGSGTFSRSGRGRPFCGGLSCPLDLWDLASGR